jgi:diguanylate cyclase (GGDEF)-like protein
MSYTVLLLDDDPQFRNLVRPILKAKDIRLIEAATGNQAMSIIGNTTLDLIVVDGLLPDTDGIQFIRDLRTIGNNARIIFVSAFWRDAESYKVLTDNLGVGLVIHKPVIPTVFGEQIDSELQRLNIKSESTPVDDNLHSVLDGLAAEYIQQLPEKLSQLSQTLAEARKNPHQSAFLAEARLCAHKLRGTAGSFGFDKLGQAMGQIEDGLTELSKGKALKPPETWATIESAMFEAKALIDKKPEIATINEPMPIDVTSNISLSRILVVDNDDSFIQSVEEWCKQRLIDVLVTKTPEQALSQVQDNLVEAAFVNVDLENIGEQRHLQFAKKMRTFAGLENLPVAFVSASDNTFINSEKVQLPYTLYIKKPVSKAKLEHSIKQMAALRKLEQPRVLVLDDDEYFVKRVSSVLRNAGMQTFTLCDPLKLVDSLNEIEPDLLLLDLVMPTISGFDICRMLRTMSSWQQLPIIFLTSQTNLETRVAAFRCGGDDYLPKPFADEELIARVRLRVERTQLLKERANKDSVTGLWLKHAFIEQLSIMLAGAKRQTFPVTIGVLAINDFKEIHQSCGPTTSDAILATLGKLINNRFRAADLKGRWSQEEFIIAFHGVSKQQISAALDSFLQEFKTIAFPGSDGKTLSASFSTGLATFPIDGDSTHSLIQIAHQRLLATMTNTFVASKE